MGFSGSFVLCRSAAGFEEIEAVWSRDQGLVWSEIRVKEWRIGQWLGTAFADQAAEMLVELVQETGRPALTGYVVDSDCVDIHGLGVTTAAWRACLAREAMAGYLEEVDMDLEESYPDPDSAARNAEDWAREAELRPDAATLRLLFAVEQADPFAEDLFFDLVDRLGVSASLP